jgi:hypothetical protein
MNFLLSKAVTSARSLVDRGLVFLSDDGCGVGGNVDPFYEICKLAHRYNTFVKTGTKIYFNFLIYCTAITCPPFSNWFLSLTKNFVCLFVEQTLFFHRSVLSKIKRPVNSIHIPTLNLRSIFVNKISAHRC